MTYVEIRKDGRLVALRRVEDDRTRDGCVVQIEGVGEATVTAGQVVTVGDYEVTVTDDAAADDEVLGSQDFTRGPTITFVGEALDASADVDLPTVEGYEVTGRLGEGGMGVVWRARQLSTGRDVALKLLTAGRFHSDKARSRFEREVELSARLEHPHIARVYDSGLHRGVYYYAMELIDGVRLDEHVEAGALSQRGILELFGEICRAVQHAHQRGVIHRDLKPSNILVTADGRPHVLDFGLAKAYLGDDSGVLVSQEGDVAGTPAYMSPEQAAGRVGETDTRSDVYSLGVILYRLLTGRFPHDVTGRQWEVLQRITEQDIRRPRQVTREVDAELEALLLKALSRDPEGRYASAGELGEDIGNYLAGDPLTARKPTMAYFLRKRLRKHRLPLAVAGAVLASLIGLAVYAYVGVRAERDRAIVAERETAVQRDVTKRESETRRRALYRSRISLANAELHRSDIRRVRELLSLCPQDLRGWEWYYLRTACDRSAWTFRGHEGDVYGVAFHPEGTRVASAGLDRTVRIWDTTTGEQVHVLRGHTSYVTEVRYTPQGDRIISAGGRGEIRVWEAESGKEVRGFEGHGGKDIRDMVLSRDGRRLYSAGDDRTIRVWDVENGTELRRLVEADADLYSPALDSREKQIAYAVGPAIEIRDLASGETLLKKNVFALASGLRFVKNDKHILYGTSMGEVKCREIATGNVVKQRSAHDRPVQGVAILDRGGGSPRIASAGMATIRVWPQSLQTLRVSLRGHEGRISALAAGPDGKWLVSGSHDGTVKLWSVDAPRGLVTGRYSCGGGVSICFSPDGRHVAYGTVPGKKSPAGEKRPKRVAVCDVTTGEAEFFLDPGSEEDIRIVLYRPDGRQIATASDDETIRIWDAATGRELRAIRTGSVARSLSYSPDGKRLAYAQSRDLIRILDSDTGKEVSRIASRGPAVLCVAFSPDGRSLAGGDDRGNVTLFDAATGQQRKMFRGPEGTVQEVSFCPDGRRLLSGDGKGRITIWDVASGGEICSFGSFNSGTDSAAFSPDGRRVLTTDGGKTAKLWDAETGTQLLDLGPEDAMFTMPAAFSPDGRRIAAGSPWRRVYIFDCGEREDDLPVSRQVEDTAAPPEPLRTLSAHADGVHAVAYSRDGAWIASGGKDGTVKVWDAATGRLVRALVSVGEVTCIAFRPDGKQMASGHGAGMVLLWDAQTGRTLRTLREGDSPIHSVGFSSDGRQLISGSEDGMVRTWVADTGRLRRELGGKALSGCVSAISEDGRWIALGGRDRMVRVWDADTGALAHTLEGHRSSVWALAFSADGKRLASGSVQAELIVWSLPDGRVLTNVYSTHPKDTRYYDSIRSLAFSKDAARVIGGTTYGVRVWDVATAERVLAFPGHDSHVSSVALSPDGKHLATASLDGTVKVWSAEFPRNRNKREPGLPRPPTDPAEPSSPSPVTTWAREELAVLPNGWRVGTPVRLGSNINKSGNNGTPFITADGLTLLYSRRPSFHAKRGANLFMTVRTAIDQPWQTPTRLAAAVNSPTSEDVSPCLSADGLTLLFSSTRKGGRGHMDLWMARRSGIDQPWGAATNCGAPLSTSRIDRGACLSADGRTLWFASNRSGTGAVGEGDIWKATRGDPDEPWGRPVNLGPPVNSTSAEEAPCLSADGRAMLFASGRPGGCGETDLWMAVRPGLDTPWAAPVNLGVVNSVHRDLSPSYWDEGGVLYFSSTRGDGKFRKLYRVALLPPEAAGGARPAPAGRE